MRDSRSGAEADGEQRRSHLKAQPGESRPESCHRCPFQLKQSPHLVRIIVSQPAAGIATSPPSGPAHY